MLHGLSVR